MSEQEAAPEYAPWKQRKDEPAKAYDRFQCYCFMGRERSIDKVRIEYEYKTDRHLKTWSVKYEWQNRVRAYDAYVDRLFLDQRTRDALKVREEHLKNAAEMRKKITERIKSIDVNEMDLGTLMLNAIRVWRLENEILQMTEVKSNTPIIQNVINNEITESSPTPHRKLPTDKELAELDAKSLYEVFRSVDD